MRETALKRYYLNPVYCLECKKSIDVAEYEKPCQTQKRKFCSRSCSVTYNNRIQPKRKAKTSGICEECGTAIDYTRAPSQNSYRKKKFCETCRPIIRGRKMSTLGSAIVEQTIDELKSTMKSYWSWRVAITKHARRTYVRAGLPQKCLVCGYDKHFDVCHKKDVSTYPGDTKVGEINKLDNLVALCKNHHWEFDKGLLELPEGTS